MLFTKFILKYIVALNVSLITFIVCGFISLGNELAAIAQSENSTQNSKELAQKVIKEVKFIFRSWNDKNESLIYKDEDFRNDLDINVQSLIGKPINETTRLEADKIAEQITEKFYLGKGYITSRAQLLGGTITSDGVVSILITEGGLCNIVGKEYKETNEGAKFGLVRLDVNYLLDRIQIPNTIPLNKNRLEDQLRLLKNDPQFENIEFSIRPAKIEGAPEQSSETCQNPEISPDSSSNIVVIAKEAKTLTINTAVNNYSPPSVGSEQAVINITYLNPSGLGDQAGGIGDRLSATYYRSFTGGSNVYDFSYSAPLNPMNGTLNLRTAITRSAITEAPFDRFGITAKSQSYEIQYRQPLIRSFVEEFALSFGFNYKDGQTFLYNNLATPFGFGADKDGITRTSVFSLGQDYLKRDESGAWFLQSLFKLGTGLGNATINAAPIPDSRFISWNFQAQRWQKLNDDNLLILQADLQLTPDSLLPSEQFLIGGGQTLRGYRQSARSGDNGFRFSAENRVTLQRDGAGQPILQLAPFVNMGSVWNREDNPNFLLGQNFLASIGTGVIWEPFKNLVMRFDYAIPLVKLSDKSNNIQDQGINFSLGYKF
jgi:hemolysin activation/secretion protein